MIHTDEMNPNFILIDGSYFCFYRYHSLLTWWKNAYPEQLDVLKDPYQNEKFVEKFKKTFVENVEKLPNNLKINKNIKPIIIAAKDCKRENIWRNTLLHGYKANRSNGPEDGFMGGPFFKMVYDDNLFVEGGVKTILKHSKLEADDCIALTVEYIIKKYSTATIYIIASDKDYLQLASPQVHIYNLAFKKLTDQKSCMGNPECDLFCKIVSGDVSDNIPSVFPKCGIKTALKYFENRALFESKLKESENYQKQYELNKILIDFNYIPTDLAHEFMSSPI